MELLLANSNIVKCKCAQPINFLSKRHKNQIPHAVSKQVTWVIDNGHGIQIPVYDAQIWYGYGRGMPRIWREHKVYTLKAKYWIRYGTLHCLFWSILVSQITVTSFSWIIYIAIHVRKSLPRTSQFFQEMDEYKIRGLIYIRAFRQQFRSVCLTEKEKSWISNPGTFS